MKKLLLILFLPAFAYGQTIRIVNPHNISQQPIVMGINHGVLPNKFPVLAQRQTGTVTSWSWSVDSGPSGATFDNVNDSTTMFSFPSGVGTYIIRCTINGGGSDTAIVNVIDVNESGKAACRVGAPQTFTISTSSNQLTY